MYYVRIRSAEPSRGLPASLAYDARREEWRRPGRLALSGDILAITGCGIRTHSLVPQETVLFLSDCRGGSSPRSCWTGHPATPRGLTSLKPRVKRADPAGTIVSRSAAVLCRTIVPYRGTRTSFRHSTGELY